MENLLALNIAVFSGFGFAFLLLWIPAEWIKNRAWTLSLIPLGIFIYFLSIYFRFTSPIGLEFLWIPSLQIHWSIYLDGLSLLFALLISGIGFLVFLYSYGYLHSDISRFFGFLLLFMGSMLGIAVSDNMLIFFIFWELTSISSFFLIGFNRKDPGSNQSAIQALSVTGIGGLFLLFSVLGLYSITGSFSFQNLANYTQEIQSHYLYIPILIGIFLGAFTKSAQFPFHFWLPGAMKAPTPVSTYLHSATMVKAGIFLLARLNPSFHGSPYWGETLMIAGGITMVLGAVRSIFHNDLKSILAYTTISALGILVFLLGIGSEYSLKAFTVFILVHAFYKAGLFLVTGIIDHQTGSRNIFKLNGLRLSFPGVFVATLLLIASNAGIPFSFGYLGKELIYESILKISHTGNYWILLSWFSNICLLVAGCLIGLHIFLRKSDNPDQEKYPQPGLALSIPVFIFAFLSTVFGVFPEILLGKLHKISLESISPNYFATNSGLSLWHGFNSVFYWSLATILFGIIFYLLYRPSEKLNLLCQNAERLAPGSLIPAFFRLIFRLASFLTEHIVSLRLRANFIWIFLFFLLLGGWKLGNLDWGKHLGELEEYSWSIPTYYDLAIVFSVVISVILVVFSNSRFTAIVSLGILGFSICLLFLFYSAPDLAMTQFSIDTLTVILFVFVLGHLPKYKQRPEKFRGIFDLFLAFGFGGMISTFLVLTYTLERTKEISSYYLDNSYLLAKGKNVVNVILVDFRGIDTMIEIVVLSIAAIGVYGLIKFRESKEGDTF
jgi:multicomponent Na+:H+ antiporter subunit A